MATKVEATDIKIGMYVSELDRPWIDTDFLFQGFLIYDDEQIEKLQKLCKFIYVDEDQSTLGLFASTTQIVRPKKTLDIPRFSQTNAQAPQYPYSTRLGSFFLSTIRVTNSRANPKA